jgi:outer membrane protein OmpA-like peptidoglycan-associated protein
MSKQRLFALLLVWGTILGMGVGAYRLFFKPKKIQQEQQAKQEAHENLIAKTGSNRHYDHKVAFGIDSFSGYAVFRSPEFAAHLSSRSIKLDLQDDGANYTDRIKKLASGELQMAVFTVDALVKASATINDLPATIVAIGDETKGADAALGYKNKYPNIQSLNNAKTKFVLTPDSPSEMLTRVVQAHFDLGNLQGTPYVQAQSARDVYEQYRKANQNDDFVYVVWEPYIQKMLENPNIHVIVDSSNFRGYVVDVIVTSRDFLIKNPQVVQEVVQSYFRAAYEHSQDMPKLILDDGKLTGEVMSPTQAKKLVDGIRWKNVLENYAHMGVTKGGASSSLQSIEDIITNITTVLVRSKAIHADPTQGQPNKLYYDQILSTMAAANYHPGTSEESSGTIRQEVILEALSEDQWKSLLPVGNLQVESLVFARGTSRLTDDSKVVLDQLIKHLLAFPTYYVAVKGNASTDGDIEANKDTAMRRATAAAAYLTDHGVDKNRIRAVAGEPTGETNVTFMLGQRPY